MRISGKKYNQYGGNPGGTSAAAGDATAANQVLQITQETTTATETTATANNTATIKTDTDKLVNSTGLTTDPAQTDPTQNANEIELLKGLLTFILTLGSETDGTPSNPINNNSATIQNVLRLIANNLYVLTNDLVLPYNAALPNSTFGALGQAKDAAVLSGIITSPGTGGYTINAAIKYLCQNTLTNLNSPLSGLLTQLQAIVTALGASLPLPTGAATSALQTTGNTSLSDLDTNLGAKTDASVSNPASSASVIAALKGLQTILLAALPLPTGASTSALQTTLNNEILKLPQGNNSYLHAAANVGLTSIKGTAGQLKSVSINKAGSAGNTLTIQDGGAVVAVIDTTTARQISFDIAFSTSLQYILATGTPADLTFSYS